MRLYLTRQRNGLYMLTLHAPQWCAVEGTATTDAYVVPGEPIGIRNLCPAVLKILDQPLQLKRGESAQVELAGRCV